MLKKFDINLIKYENINRKPRKFLEITRKFKKFLMIIEVYLLEKLILNVRALA